MFDRVAAGPANPSLSTCKCMSIVWGYVSLLPQTAQPVRQARKPDNWLPRGNRDHERVVLPPLDGDVIRFSCSLCDVQGLVDSKD